MEGEVGARAQAQSGGPDWVSSRHRRGVPESTAYRSPEGATMPELQVTDVTFAGRSLPYSSAELTIDDPTDPTRWKLELSGTDGAFLKSTMGQDLMLVVATSDGRTFSGTAHAGLVMGGDAIVHGSDAPNID
jgi:hypothetical protein